MTGSFDRPTWHGLFLLRVGLGWFLAVNGTHSFGRKLDEVASRPAELFHSPIVEALHLPFPPPALELWGPLIGVLGWMVALGIFSRFSCFAAACAVFYVISCVSGFGYFNHGTIVVPQMLLVLSVSPGADACSLDRLARALRRRARGEGTRASLVEEWLGPPTPPYGMRLAALIMALLYGAAGISKLRYVPAEWLSGQTLRTYLSDMQRQYWLGPSDGVASLLSDPPIWSFGYIGKITGRGSELAEHPMLCAAIAIGTVVIELFVPAGLLASPRIRAMSCIVLLAFQLSIHKLMGIPFRAWMVVLVALFPWTELFRAVRSLRATGA
jgi:uncharacterized membrane protein YphA (DoxX/SURF4 family)